MSRIGQHVRLRVPRSLEPAVIEILTLTDRFCGKHLDTEYRELCRKLVAKLARKRPSPLVRGSLRIWSGAVIYTIGSINFLLDRTQRPHLSGVQISRLTGVPQSTLMNKAKMIRGILRLRPLMPEFSKRELLENPARAWMISGDPLVAGVAGVLEQAIWTNSEVRMSGDDMGQVAATPITEVLVQFLEAQRNRLAPRTFGRYCDVVGLLEDCLNGYAYQSLDKPDAKLFDELYNAEGDQHREFCEIFGPEHILPNMDEFLGYFMVRKVMAGEDLLRAAGTVTRKLAVWLAERGCAGPGDAESARERGASAARDLPRAKKLTRLLYRFAEQQEWFGDDEEIQDYFRLTRVERGKIWLEGLDGREHGPIDVPQKISRLCKVGWDISGTVARVGKTWRLVEAWNVYPR